MFTAETYRLARQLGILSSLLDRKACHGFANGCVCGCKPRKRAEQAPAQPWEQRRAA